MPSFVSSVSVEKPEYSVEPSLAPGGQTKIVSDTYTCVEDIIATSVFHKL